MPLAAARPEGAPAQGARRERAWIGHCKLGTRGAAGSDGQLVNGPISARRRPRS